MSKQQSGAAMAGKQILIYAVTPVVGLIALAWIVSLFV